MVASHKTPHPRPLPEGEGERYQGRLFPNDADTNPYHHAMDTLAWVDIDTMDIYLVYNQAAANQALGAIVEYPARE
jgi:hypothetical protein